MRQQRGWFWLLIFGLGITLMPAPNYPLHAQQDPALNLHILYVDDRTYPQVDIYFNLTNSNEGSYRLLEAASPRSFVITSEAGQITPQKIEPAQRQFVMMFVFDLTSSVSPTELAQMQAAARLLIEDTLTPQDQVGLLTFNQATTNLLQPLTDNHELILNTLADDTQFEIATAGGNAAADGIYNALATLPPADANIRPTLVIFSDATTGNIDGNRSIETIQDLTTTIGANVYVLHFLTDTIGFDLPRNPPTELVELAEESGGIFWQGDGELIDEPTEDENAYTDDTLLSDFARQLSLILQAEQRLTVKIDATADDAVYPMRIRFTDANNDTTAASGQFRAWAGRINIQFANLLSGEKITLPFEVVVSLSPPLPNPNALLFRIDPIGSGDIQLGAFDPETLSYPLDDLPLGPQTLKAVIIDEEGRRFEQTIRITILEAAESTDDENEPRALNSSTDSSSESEGFNFRWLLLVGAVLSAGIGIMTGVFLRNRQQPEATSAIPASPRASPPPSSQPQTLNPPHPATLTTSPPATAFNNVARGLLIGPNNEQFPLYDGENTIGRHGSNRVQVADATVSRYHAVIQVEGELFEYRDWQALQPTTISGHVLLPDERYALVEGDEIMIGMTTFRFKVNSLM